MQFIRFIVPERDPRTGQALGLLRLAHAVLRLDDIEVAHEHVLENLHRLEKRLPVADRFARTRKLRTRKRTGGFPAQARCR